MGVFICPLSLPTPTPLATASRRFLVCPYVLRDASENDPKRDLSLEPRPTPEDHRVREAIDLPIVFIDARRCSRFGPKRPSVCPVTGRDPEVHRIY